jgi:S1-C subfamily serine protease
MLSRTASAAAVISAVALVLAAVSGYFVSLQEKRSEDLNSEVAALRDSLNQLSGRLLGIEAEVQNLSRGTLQLSSQISQLANTNVRLLGELAALNQSVSTQTVVEIISALNQSLTSKLITLNQSLAALKERVAEAELNVSQLNSTITAVNKELATISRQTPGRVYEKVYKSVVVIRTSVGQGSGFIYGENLVLTNWHVVEGVNEADIQFYDQTRTTATVLATDPYSDVAVLKIDRKPADALPLKLGNSSAIWIGETVVAVGNPLGLTGSLSVGVISQVNRLLDLEPIIVPVLQLDITIAPGSSGGPLLNLDGEVVGVTNAGTSVGFSFAIPSNMVRRVASDLISKGYYQHPYFGFSALTLTPENIRAYNILDVDPFQNGLMVTKVMPNTPAEKAGLRAATQVRTTTGLAYKPGDIILAVDGRRTYTFEEWSAYVSLNVSPNQKVALTILREGKTINLEITPTARPPYQG